MYNRKNHKFLSPNIYSFQTEKNSFNIANVEKICKIMKTYDKVCESKWKYEKVWESMIYSVYSWDSRRKCAKNSKSEQKVEKVW